MRARTFQVIIVCVILFPLGGCLTSVDPSTGQKQVSVDPNSPVIMTGEAAAQGIMALGPFFGATGGLIAGIAAGILAAWKKVKPSLVAAKTEAAQYHAATAATVTALESFKASNPMEWTKLGELISTQLTKQNMDPLVIENVIRAVRGLPAKA
jgi:hypothetical protein